MDCGRARTKVEAMENGGAVAAWASRARTDVHDGGRSTGRTRHDEECRCTHEADRGAGASCRARLQRDPPGV
jgi:hypothetical protein